MPDAQQRQCHFDDTYLFGLTTPVLSTGEHQDGRPWMALRDNIFHPQGGGQPSDVGWIDDRPAAVARSGAEVVLSLAGELPPVGSSVHARLDPQVRLAHAALHTAGHLLDALLRGQGHSFARSNHFPDQARVEASAAGPVDKDALRDELEQRLAEARHADLAVTAAWDAGTRIVSIAGLHDDPCSGTHLRSLGEFGSITLRSVKTKSGTIKVGYDARPHPDLLESLR